MTSLVEKYQELEQFLIIGKKYNLILLEDQIRIDETLSDLWFEMSPQEQDEVDGLDS